MLCPYCKEDKNKVIDKRDNNDKNVTRRRRECKNCSKRFTTYERHENVHLNVIKRSGSVQPFDREKLTRSIEIAVQKRPITKEQIEEMVDDIEANLLIQDTTDINSGDIGKMVLTRLKKIDKLAYILFSTVYNEFKTVEDMIEEIKDLQHE
jgi:transcriptional repressor NrdR